MNIKKTKNIFEGFLQKIYIRLRDRLDFNPKSSEEEQFCTEICSKLISIRETKLTIAPISGKRFLKNDEKEMFIVVHNRVISLINHVYSYNVFYENDSLYQKVIQQFDNELERRRQVLEDEIKSNIKHSLTEILKKIS